MSRAALTPEEIAAFRKKAARAATRLFAEHGYDGVTMRAIAKELDVSPMAPYRYFESKDEIFALVRADAARRFGDALEKPLQAASNAVEGLIGMRTAYVQYALRHPDQYRIMFDVRTSPEGHFASVDAALKRLVAISVDAARAGIEAGLFRGSDPTLISYQLLGYLHGLVSLHLAGRLVSPTLQEVLDSAIFPGGPPAVTPPKRARRK